MPTVDDVERHVAALDTESSRKICAHRSNNVPMYRQALQHFACIEIDVHLEPADGGPPGVYHPPETNNYGLTLDLLLTHETLPSGRLWLDVKDMSERNWQAFLSQLLTRIPADRRRDIIVETPWSDPGVERAAAAFRQRGFSFSYYLPTNEAIRCGAIRSSPCEALRAQVARTVALGFSHLSFDARAWTFVKTMQAQLPSGTRLLTWDLSRSWPQHELLDESDIYIIKYPSRFAT